MAGPGRALLVSALPAAMLPAAVLPTAPLPGLLALAVSSCSELGRDTSRARIAASSEIFMPDVAVRTTASALLAAHDASSQNMMQHHGTGCQDMAVARPASEPGVSSRMWPAAASWLKLAPPK